MAEEETPRYYANQMQAHIGAYDFTLDFFYKRPEAGPNASADPVCRVSMGIGHAKSMIPIMARLVAQYEAQFGAVPAPGYEEKSKE